MTQAAFSQIPKAITDQHVVDEIRKRRGTIVGWLCRACGFTDPVDETPDPPGSCLKCGHPGPEPVYETAGKLKFGKGKPSELFTDERDLIEKESDMAKCNMPGCDNRSYSRGICKQHYNRWARFKGEDGEKKQVADKIESHMNPSKNVSAARRRGIPRTPAEGAKVAQGPVRDAGKPAMADVPSGAVEKFAAALGIEGTVVFGATLFEPKGLPAVLVTAQGRFFREME